jgi:hypothetical protein
MTSEGYVMVDNAPDNPLINGLPYRKNIISFVAKSLANTNHPKEVIKTRVFKEDDLKGNAKSLLGRKLGLNHKSIIDESMIFYSQWNDETKQIEGLACVGDSIYGRVKSNEFSGCSIDFLSQETKTSPDTALMQDVGIYGLSLLERSYSPPGDKNASIELVESAIPQNLFILAEGAITIHGEPFAEYIDFDDCVDKNQDRDNPSGYCATIMRAVECSKECPKTALKVESSKPDEAKVATPVEESKESKRIKELEIAYSTVIKVNEELKVNQAKVVEKARKEAVREVVTEIEGKLVKSFFENRAPHYIKIQNEEIKRIIFKKKQESQEE